MKYAHTNIICNDIEKISQFYINVFKCSQMGKESTMQGDWLDKGTGLKNAKARSVVLNLPGFDKNGPTLEIFEYEQTEDVERKPNSNSKGFGHIAFSVDNVEEVLEKVLENGGATKGELVKKEFGSGILTYTYVTDPEGNIIEIQNWTAK